ncbi:helix-turn-helix transcriptional regulator [Streptomyces sp. NPDC001380]|uniref:helix-turn-helix transcriptional regulator n=1 Tax=Streptomyces sp. NPDC001380 TaxID=3364566 RepID=UPI0036A663C1
MRSAPAASPATTRRPLATPEELAAHLGVPIATLYAWSYRRQGPTALKIGRHLRYRWQDVDAWLESQSADRRPRR